MILSTRYTVGTYLRDYILMQVGCLKSAILFAFVEVHYEFFLPQCLLRLDIRVTYDTFD